MTPLANRLRYDSELDQVAVVHLHYHAARGVADADHRERGEPSGAFRHLVQGALAVLLKAPVVCTPVLPVV